MEGLIKGLIDVALDALGGGDDDSGSSDQRPRSTWAEVVSSGNEEGEAEEEKRSNYESHHQSSRRSRKEQSEAEEETRNNYESHQSSWRSRKEQSERRSDGDGGWEVVGHKKQQQGHPLTRPYQAAAENRHQYKRPPSEQEYAGYVDHSVDMELTREELEDMSKACSRLWDLDLNRLVPGKDYEIDCGGGKKVYQEGDMTSGSLFSWLGDDIFRRPTYSRFCSLLDNYNPREGFKEVITSEEMHEQAAFIEEISRTAPIKYLHKYLAAKELVSESTDEFKRMLTNLWFDLYGRGGGSSSSSAFEHVFVGEIKGREETEVSGFHNWIQFYLEEVKGNIDYQGYIFPRRRGERIDSETQVLTIQFEWNGILKSVSSTLIGVSPEFEVALYTLCFFVGREDNPIILGPYSVNVKCYRLGRNKIGSVFPIAE